jgi:hypothetical protein
LLGFEAVSFVVVVSPVDFDAVSAAGVESPVEVFSPTVPFFPA